MRFLLLLACLSACQTNEPIAEGDADLVAEATFAARKCGMLEIRHDPLDPENSMLLYGDSNPQFAVDCTKRWIAENAPEIALQAEDMN